MRLEEKNEEKKTESLCVSVYVVKPARLPERAPATETEHREAEQQIMTVQG